MESDQMADYCETLLADVRNFTHIVQDNQDQIEWPGLDDLQLVKTKIEEVLEGLKELNKAMNPYDISGWHPLQNSSLQEYVTECMRRHHKFGENYLTERPMWIKVTCDLALVPRYVPVDSQQNYALDLRVYQEINVELPVKSSTGAIQPELTEYHLQEISRVDHVDRAFLWMYSRPKTITAEGVYLLSKPMTWKGTLTMMYCIAEAARPREVVYREIQPREANTGPKPLMLDWRSGVHISPEETERATSDAKISTVAETYNTIQCHGCRYDFHDRSIYERHMRVCGERNPTVCFKCGFLAISKEALRRHRKRCGRPENEVGKQATEGTTEAAPALPKI